MSIKTLAFLLAMLLTAAGCNKRNVAAPAGDVPADGPRAKVARLDEQTDYTKLSNDKLIAALDDTAERVQLAAAAEIFERGPDAIRQARLVLMDLTTQSLSNQVRLAGAFAEYSTQMEKPSRFRMPFLRDPGVRRQDLAGLEANSPERKLTRAAWALVGPDVKKACESGPEAERAAALKVISGIASIDRKEACPLVVPVLATALRRSEGETRELVFKTLVGLGTFATTDVLPAALELLAAEDEAMRTTGLKLFSEMIAYLPNDSPEVAKAIKPFINHKDLAVRQQAGYALFLVGEIEAGLPHVLDRQWPDVELDARPFAHGPPMTKSGAGRQVPAFPPSLGPRLLAYSPERNDRLRALLKPAVLGDAQPRRRNALRMLEKLTDGGPLWQDLAVAGDEDTRAFAWKALLLLGLPPNDGKLPVAPGANADESTKLSYVRMLGNYRPANIAVVDALKSACSDPYMRKFAWMSVPDEPELVKQSMPIYIEGIKANRKEFELRLLQRLSELGPAASATIEELIAWADDPHANFDVRMRVLGALAAIQPDPKHATAILKISDYNDPALPAAAQVLLKMKSLPAEVTTSLTKRLQPLGKPGQEAIRVLLIKADPKNREKYLPELLELIAKSPPPSPPPQNLYNGIWSGNHNPLLVADLLIQLDPPPAPELTRLLSSMSSKYVQLRPFLTRFLWKLSPRPSKELVADLVQILEKDSPYAPHSLDDYAPIVIDGACACATHSDPEIRILAINVLGWFARVMKSQEINFGSPAAVDQKARKQHSHFLAFIENATKDEVARVRDHAYSAMALAEPTIVLAVPKQAKSMPEEQQAAVARARKERDPERLQSMLARLEPGVIGHELERLNTATRVSQMKTELLAPHRERLIELLIKSSDPWQVKKCLLDALTQVPRSGAALAEVAERGDDATRFLAVERLPRLPTGEAAAAEPYLRKQLQEPEKKKHWAAARMLARLNASPGPEVIESLRGAYALTAQPEKYAEQLYGPDWSKKISDAVNEIKRIAARDRIELAGLLARIDGEFRQSYLELLVDSITSRQIPIPFGMRSDHSHASDHLRELGEIGKSVAPKLAAALAVEKEVPRRYLLARALRAVDPDAAKTAGVR